MKELGEFASRRNSFQFLNVKLLHNQSPENYIQLFEKLKIEDYVVNVNKTKAVELVDFYKSQKAPGVYIGKMNSFMRMQSEQWYNRKTKKLVAGPEIDENLCPNTSEGLFYFIPERHRIAVSSASPVNVSLVRLFIIEASERLLGKQQLTVTTETDRGFIEEIKNAKEVSRIYVTWSYTNGDVQKGLAKILDDAAKKAGAARISAELYSAPGETLAVDEEDLSGAVLELSISNAEGEASATIRNPEYNKNGKQIKANRKNVTTRNYPLKYVFTSKLPEVPGKVYDFIMSRFK